MFYYVDPLVDLLNIDSLVEISFLSVIVRLILAVILGGLLGLERAKKHHAAGFRTYILVCVGSTIAMMTNQFITDSTGLGDSARLGAQVISGIGFLGAGTILVTSRNQIKGLTTAAGLWACATLGLSIGIGFYTLALISAFIIVLIFSILPYFEDFLTRHSRSMSLHVELIDKKALKSFIEHLRGRSFEVLSIEYNRAYSDTGLSVYSVSILINKGKSIDHNVILESFKALDYIYYIEELSN